MALLKKRILISGLALLALAACERSAPKLPHVVTETSSHTVIYSDKAAAPYAGEQASLDAFLDGVHPLAISYAGLSANDTNPRALARVRALRSYLIRDGVDARVIHLLPSRELDSHQVVLSIAYSEGLPPEPCPDWSRNTNFNYVDSNESNFGCAYYNNLIVQLADPADYENGHGKAQFEGLRESAAVQRYFGGTAGSGSSASSGSASGSSGSTTTTTTSP